MFYTGKGRFCVSNSRNFFRRLDTIFFFFSLCIIRRMPKHASLASDRYDCQSFLMIFSFFFFFKLIFHSLIFFHFKKFCPSFFPSESEDKW